MPITPFTDPATLPVGLGNTNFSTVGGGMAAQPVINTLYDRDPFSQMRVIFRRHGSRPTFLQILKLLGNDFNRGVAAPTTGHYERDWTDNLVKIGSIITASAGAGTDVVVALHADSMYNASVTVGGVAAQASYPRVGQIIYFPNGKKGYITVKNTAVTPHRLTLRPLQTTTDLAGAITAAASYFISDNAYAEGSNLPPGVIPRIFKYTNEFQIVKEAAGITGSELTNKTFAQWEQGTDGSIWLILKPDTMERFDKMRSGALLWGQTINNITATGATVAVDYDIPIKGTEGLISFVTTNAHTDTYTVGAYSIDDFYALVAIMESENVGTNVLLSFDGYALFIEREKALAALFDNSNFPMMLSDIMAEQGISFDDWDPVSDKDFVAWLGFRGYHVGGYTVYFKLLPEFSQAVGAGATGYDFRNWSITIPLARTSDVTSGEQRAYIGYEWKQLGSYSREAVVAELAGVGAAGSGGYRTVAVNEYDAMRCGMVSEIAFHAATANKIVVQRPV